MTHLVFHHNLGIEIAVERAHDESDNFILSGVQAKALKFDLLNTASAAERRLHSHVTCVSPTLIGERIYKFTGKRAEAVELAQAIDEAT